MVCETAPDHAQSRVRVASTFGVAAGVYAHLPVAPGLMRILFSLIVLFVVGLSAHAQPANSDCATAQQLCAQQPVIGDNTGAVGLLPGYCGTSNLVWYSFTTNSVPGDVVVSLDNINCPAVPGMDNELSVVVLYSTTNSCDPASFQVLSGDPCLTQDSLDFSVLVSGTSPNTEYFVVVAGVQDDGALAPAECPFQITVSGPAVDVVNVTFDAGPDVTIGEGESAQLAATGGPPYDWSPLSGLSGNGIPDPIAAPSGSTLYSVSTIIDGCTYTDVVNVFVIRRIIPPNTFTPNEDGVTDTWEIPGISDYPGAEVLIYDRWGQKVYSGIGYREPWDGTNNGRKLPVGTYYYHIQLNQLEGQAPPYTGFISIVR